MTLPLHPRPLVGVAIAIALLLGSCGSPRLMCSAAPSDTPPSASGFVTTNGRSFEVDGKPFRFVGVNIYDAAASDRYSCRSGSRMSDGELTRTLRYLHDEAGATVLRFWAYQTYTQGATYWGGVDRVLAAARSAGMRVIPVLEDGPGDCTSSSIPKATYQGSTWFTHGYRIPDVDALSYRSYVAKITAHYADDRTILGWSMMNEAETTARTTSGQSVLVGFSNDVASVIHRSDPHHLVTLGTQSNSAPGASGPDFSAVYGQPGLSFAEVHDWGYRGSDTAPMPGSPNATPPSSDSPECASVYAPIGCSFARSAELDKPLIVGEAGMKGVTASDRALRATRLRAKMDAAFAAGASGYLIWSVTGAETDGYDVSTTDHDPLIAQLRRVASAVAQGGSAGSPLSSSCQAHSP